MSEEANAAPTENAPLPPVGWADYRATAAMLLAFVVTQVLAFAMARPSADAGLQAFEDTGDPTNVVYYALLLFGFTALILYLHKKGIKWAIQGVILLAVGSTVMYVVAPILMSYANVPTTTAWITGALVGLASVTWLYKHPEWYVVDIVGVLVAAGAAAIFGISLEPWLVIIMLVGLAVYDAIAVYKTKHMLDLADSVIELRLPVLLVIPKHKGYSFLHEASQFKEANAENKESREAYFLGLGDLVMPTILAVSALAFGFGQEAAVGAAIGTLFGYAVLMSFVLKGNPQAGLPLLNGGAILGFLVGLYVATGSLRFW